MEPLRGSSGAGNGTRGRRLLSRFKERPLQWTDIIGRFESSSYQDHLHNSVAFVERLKDEGKRIWKADTEQLHRWRKGCDELRAFLHDLSRRHELEPQGLETVMREFIHEFEHATGRMDQMLYGISHNFGNDQIFREIRGWMDLVFRTSIYALVAGWNSDKHERGSSLRTTVSLRTGHTKTEGIHGEMKAPPRKYRRATKKL